MLSARLRALLIVCLLGPLGAALFANPAVAKPKPKSTPDWVERSGTADAFPSERYLTGFAQARGKEEATESAKQQAVADLARQISVQIESSVVDTTRETNGALHTDLTSQIRATSDIRLEGVRFEMHRKRKVVWALAVLERLPAAASRRNQRDRALVVTKRCLESAEELERANLASQALDAYRSCRLPLNEALEHEAIAAALRRGSLLQDDSGTQIADHATRIANRIRVIPHQDAKSIRSAADSLAAQLAGTGIGPGRNLQVVPLLYQGRDISSPLGRELALALESAIGRSPSKDKNRRDVVIRGTYREGGSDFQIRVNAKDADSGDLIASAEIALAQEAVPDGMDVRPAGFEGFAADADKLTGGEVVSGDLRVELRTDRGRQSIVYDEGEEISLYVRVNQPAWVRLIYRLTTGELVPITQGWFIDEDQVNQLVQYPTSFEIVAPFGVEMVHAMATLERPEKLRTREALIDGEPYEILRRGADEVVETRGIARKKKVQVAEQTLQLTTMRKSR